MTLEKLLRGQYIAFDGPDGCGKSTIVARLTRFLREARAGHTISSQHGPDYDVHATREPGGTEYGELIRNVLLRPDVQSALCDEAESLLFMAARAQLVREKIKPLQAKGYTILSDRYASSTFAYQCEASGLSWDKMLQVFEFAVPHNLRPDLLVILDLPVEVSFARVQPKPLSTLGPVGTSTLDPASVAATSAPSLEHVVRDRIEQKHGTYHEATRRGYLKYAERFVNCIVVDASGSREEVFDSVIAAVTKHFANRLI